MAIAIKNDPHTQLFGDEAEKFGNEAKSFAATASEKAKEAATFVGEKAAHATEAVGAGMESLGETVRDHLPSQGVLADAGQCVANKLETGGRYLELKGLQGIGDDVTNMIRQNPIPALLIGLGVGFVLARMIRR